MARYIPVVIVGLVAVGLFIGGVTPAWWITGLVALGLALVITVKASSARFAPFVPAVAVGLAALGLLIAGLEPAWWITGLVAIGIALVVFMSRH